MSSGRAYASFGLGENGAGLAFAQPRQIFVALTLAQVAPTIEAAHAAALSGCWVLGMVAYEAAPAFDTALQTRSPLVDFPLAWFAVYDAPTAEAPDEAGETLVPQFPWHPEIDRLRFADDIAAIQADIRAGRYYQSNHTTRLRSRLNVDAAGKDARALFAELCAAQPSNYRFYLDAGEWQVLSVSPELFFDWQPDGLLTTRPMKGTASRSDDPACDAEAAAGLQASTKERAENLMIVDLLRNDLSRLARLGSVEVSGLFAVEALPSLWQMTSTVTCCSLPGLGLADVFAALFPCGSVTGAPKVTAMQAISERELSPRGPYCGALGVIRPGGHATFSVGIRTVLLRQQGDVRHAECGIGSGITSGSSIAGEFAEWQAKRRFLNRAGAGFQLPD
jgi:para-aminobenzoate synthetase / 4-amino-4-deoxychorismate lyase